MAKSNSSPHGHLARALKCFDDLPEAVKWVAVTDYLHQIQYGKTPGLSFADVWRVTGSDVRVGVLGGTKLEHGIPREDYEYYHLNRELARLFVRQPLPNGKRGWSFVTGAGPGKAMAGPHFTLMEERKAFEDCASKCIAVPSGLTDEPAHPFADAKWSVRAQLDNLIREIMLLCLASDALIVYPGFKGTFGEYSLIELICYCAGRSRAGLPARPIIVVDKESNVEKELLFESGSFFGPFRSLRHNAERIGVTKQGVIDSTRVVNIAWPNVAGLIVSHIREGLSVYRGFKTPENGSY